MADYHAVLKRAIDSLPDNTGAARRAVYQRARQAIVNQLKSYEPPLSPSDITTEQLHLEEAIRKVEADAARASLGLGPAPRPASRPAPRPPAPDQEPATRSGGAQAQDAHTGGNQSGAVPAGATQASQDRPTPGRPPVPPPVDAPAAAKPAAATPGPSAPTAKARVAAPEKIEPAPPVGGGILVGDASRDTPAKDAPGSGGNGSGAAGNDVAGNDAAGNDAAGNDVAGPGMSGNGGSGGKGAAASDGNDRASKHDVAGPTETRDRFDPLSGSPESGSPESGPHETGRPGSGRPGSGRHDAIADIDAMTRGGNAPTASSLPPYGHDDLKQSRLPMIAAMVAAVIVFVGLLTVVYTQRDSILALFEGSDTPDVAQTAAPDTRATTRADEGKDSARLLTDDGSPAAPDARAVTTTRVTPPSERDSDVTVAPQGGEPEVGAEADATPTEDAGPSGVANADNTSEQPTAAPQATPVAQRAILYEESADASTGGSAEQGRVIWSTAQETAAGSDTPDTVIKATVTIPGRGVTVHLAIRPNQDDTLPASHLIELRFDLPENFAGKGVSSVPGLIMKTTEEARGDALIGASVRVADGFFWVALSSIDAERERNITLLRDRGWIDIPVLYESGKRAILTLEKGTPGDRAVQSALQAWTKG